MTSDAILIRNFDLMKHIFDNLDVLTTYYKLSQRDINILHLLLQKHSTYNAYIEIKTTDFSRSRRVVYRSINKLEDKSIITVIERPQNQYSKLKLYFTISFIKRMCSEEFSEQYEKWLEWQKTYKEKGDRDDGTNTSREN